MVELEVRGLKHLPGPDAAQQRVRRLAQGAVSRQEIEPGRVRFHQAPASPRPIPIERPTIKIDTTNTEKPNANGMTESRITRMATNTTAKSAVIFAISAKPRPQGDPPSRTCATARAPI